MFRLVPTIVYTFMVAMAVGLAMVMVFGFNMSPLIASLLGCLAFLGMLFFSSRLDHGRISLRLGNRLRHLEQVTETLADSQSKMWEVRGGERFSGSPEENSQLRALVGDVMSLEAVVGELTQTIAQIEGRMTKLDAKMRRIQATTSPVPEPPLITGLTPKSPDELKILSALSSQAAQSSLRSDQAPQPDLRPEQALQAALRPEQALQAALRPEQALQAALRSDQAPQPDLPPEAAQAAPRPESALQAALRSEQAPQSNLRSELELLTLAEPMQEAAPKHDPAVVEAIDQARFEIHIQPIVTLPQRRVEYYEVLNRLTTKDGDLILPSAFEPTATDLGKLGKLDELVFYQAIKILQRLRSGKKQTGLICNISTDLLRDRESFSYFEKSVESNRAFTSGIVLEFSQAAVNSFGLLELDSLKKLKLLGLRFSMDCVKNMDFDLSRLSELGFLYIKISADAMLGRAELGKLEIHLADMASQFQRDGIQLIVEGVEEEKDLVEMFDFNCQLAQGNLFSPPRPIRKDITEISLLPEADTALKLA